nr:ANTAR domain-containing protein [Eubacterium sp.]
PMELTVVKQLLDTMCSVRERLRRIQKKTMTLEEKMEEIRLVNRAKWALIKSCHMTEEDAHRYIQKQAMDRCISKMETAENILKIYG